MKYVKHILVIVFVILLFWVFFRDFELLKQSFIEIKKINILYPIGFVIGLWLQFFVRAYRWGLILKQYKKIKLKSIYNYTVLGFFINIFLPGRVGEAGKAIILSKKENINSGIVFASVFLERLIDSFMAVFIFIISLLFIESNSSFLLNMKKISYYLFPVFILVFILFYLINSSKLSGLIERLIEIFSKIFPKKIRQKVISFLMEFVKALKLKLSLFQFIELFFMSAFVWLMLIPFYWLLMRGFNINISLLDSVIYFSILVFFAAIPTPGMAGSLDAGSKLILTKVFNILEKSAVAYTIVFHVLILLLNIVLGFISLKSEGLSLKNIRGLKKDDMS